MDNKLSEIASLSKLLKTKVIGKRIEFYDEVGSTNDVARKLGKSGAIDGTLILAEKQTSGRGQHRKIWRSFEGKDILASLILRHRLRQNQLQRLNLIGAIAIATAIGKFLQIDTKIKLPNDVMISDRKVAGILSELHYDRNREPFIVSGFGVNVNGNTFHEELKNSATSLRLEKQQKIDRTKLIVYILEAFESNYFDLKTGKKVNYEIY